MALVKRIVLFLITLLFINILLFGATNGFTKNDVTDVILTHLHFDHCGGAVNQFKSEYHLAFPNAKYWTNKKHWEWANNPNQREKASFLKENFIPIEKENKLKFLEEGLFCKGVEIKFFHGHTESQIIPFIKKNNNPPVYHAISKQEKF